MIPRNRLCGGSEQWSEIRRACAYLYDTVCKSHYTLLNELFLHGVEFLWKSWYHEIRIQQKEINTLTGRLDRTFFELNILVKVKLQKCLCIILTCQVFDEARNFGSNLSRIYVNLNATGISADTLTLICAALYNDAGLLQGGIYDLQVT
jgi:hypothetical protein